MTPLLSVTGLAKTFHIARGWPVPKRFQVRALDGVSFALARGEALGVVGESGCGKSTTARLALRLTPADGGSVRFDGEEVLAASPARLIALRRRMQMIFQDPASALDPRQRVGDALAEPLRVHRLAAGPEARRRIEAILAEVGLPESAASRFPHEFSGGQKQRIAIARALVLSPELVFADEPVSALDVSVQAQILALMADLKARRNLAFVFISHDLGVVRHFCDRVAVMYLGRIVETGPTREVFDQPLHPYTRLIRDASPAPDPARKVIMVKTEGEPPSPLHPPSGCHFHPRCPKASALCREAAPTLAAADAGREVACHHPLH
jgi:peptide/nickel transport system ATP-binding protein